MAFKKMADRSFGNSFAAFAFVVGFPPTGGGGRGRNGQAW
jgi:hypothetical protein